MYLDGASTQSGRRWVIGCPTGIAEQLCWPPDSAWKVQVSVLNTRRKRPCQLQRSRSERIREWSVNPRTSPRITGIAVTREHTQIDRLCAGI